MSVLSWLPGALKDLVRYVPTLLMEVVDWKSMTKDLALLSNRLITGKDTLLVRQKLSTRLPINLHFAENFSKPELTDQQKHELGELLLELYFIQVISPGPFFLDLRLAHFGRDATKWTWSPGNLWGEFSPQFSQGMSELYSGFYTFDDLKFTQGLLQTGLMDTSWPQKDQEEIIQLLKLTFAGAANTAMSFELKTFQENFQNIFKFMLDRKVHLSSDFLLLGISLVTLYMSLEELGGAYEVGPLYRKALNRI